MHIVNDHLVHDWGDQFAVDIKSLAVEQWLRSRFGFHNLRHSLNSLLITGQKSDVRTTQDIIRDSSSATTIGLYTQSPMAQRIAAQESVLSAILKHA